MFGERREEEAFRGKGMTHLEEKMEVRLGLGDGNHGSCIWRDELKRFENVGIGKKEQLGHIVTG